MALQNPAMRSVKAIITSFMILIMLPWGAYAKGMAHLPVDRIAVVEQGAGTPLLTLSRSCPERSLHGALCGAERAILGQDAQPVAPPATDIWLLTDGTRGSVCAVPPPCEPPRLN